MDKVIDTSTVVASRPAGGLRAEGTERRRPGRLENPSPELIALMRRPSPQARQKIEEAIALYDAPHFEVRPQEGTFRINTWSLLQLGGAAGFCGACWYGVLQLMIRIWG